VTRPLSGSVVVRKLGLSAYPRNLKFLRSPNTKIRKAMQNVEIGVMWEVRGHPRSSSTYPFDRATFLLTVIVCLFVSLDVREQICNTRKLFNLL